MLTAAQGLVPILVDCTDPDTKRAEMERYGVDAFPTVLFLDWNGERVGELGPRDPAAVRQQILDVIRRHSRPLISESTLADGRRAAREQNKLLCVLFAEEDESPAEADLVEAILDDALETVRGRFHWIRRPFREQRRPSAEARAWNVTRPATLVVVDPAAPEGTQPMKRIADPRGLAGDLRAAIEEVERRASEGGGGGGS